MAPARGSEPDRRLPRAEILTRNTDFQEVFRDGSRHHGSLLVLIVLERPGAPRKVGFVAGKRVGNAVRRNRAKRLMREAWRHLRHRLPADGLRLVLVARLAGGTSTFDEVHRVLTELLHQAGLLPEGEPTPRRTD